MIQQVSKLFHKEVLMCRGIWLLAFLIKHIMASKYFQNYEFRNKVLVDLFHFTNAWVKKVCQQKWSGQHCIWNGYDKYM